MPTDFNQERALSVAIDAAKQAGAILREMLHVAVVREKGQNDLVTDADLAAQSAIAKVLLGAYPDHGFLGEEDATASNHPPLDPQSPKEWLWVVDPLDGTTNFAHGMHNFATSIALTYRRKPVLGAVYDPMADEMYTAIAGQGAWLNGERLSSSGCAQLNQALIAASLPPRLNPDSLEIQQFIRVMLESQSIRRLGSAALNLCYVAAGRLDGYWGGNLQAWDIAAGSLIVMESGAHLCRHDGKPFDLWNGQVLAAATATLAQSLMRCLSQPHAAPAR
ncbi:MAG: inositol monophosphatase family protein [Pirellula sp.]|jgi:myo-inositol-1(or 4)-monophosphatase